MSYGRVHDIQIGLHNCSRVRGSLVNDARLGSGLQADFTMYDYKLGTKMLDDGGCSLLPVHLHYRQSSTYLREALLSMKNFRLRALDYKTIVEI